jgi:hypothetical protein
VEGSGNPMARTYWRWRLSWNPFEVYRPASSAVGMFQITDGTFAEARRYCIHDHIVVEDGPWHDPRSCWFNALYTRVVPGHAVEMTAALLDRTVARTLERNRIATASLQQRQDLAAVIHLCGSGSRQRLCATRVPAQTRPAMRRSRRPPLPGRRQWTESVSSGGSARPAEARELDHDGRRRGLGLLKSFQGQQPEIFISEYHDVDRKCGPQNERDGSR